MKGLSMEYKEFLAAIREAVADMCDSNAEVLIQGVQKNNNSVWDAIVIHRKEECVAPTIYIKNFFDDYNNGKSIENIARNILAIDEDNRIELDFDLNKFGDYEYIKPKIMLKLINTNRNSELLKTVPHIEFLDLSVVFCCMVDSFKNSYATTIIKNIHLEKWQVDVEELYGVALTNMINYSGICFKKMNEIMLELLNGKNSDDGEIQELLNQLADDELTYPMFILTNEMKINGSTMLLYDSLLKSIAEDYGNFYIIPSSIHELIIIPESNGVNVSALLNMIAEVNATQVAWEEVLSDNLYYYNETESKITLINNIKEKNTYILNN